jgi:CheY-like chemotaxis protein
MIRVLVVDDVPDVRLALRLMLQESGFQVSDAADGDLALKQLDARKFDVVLSDIFMPGVDGLTLIDTVCRSPSSRPALIAMSGDPHVAYRAVLEAARAVGADATLVKPFTEMELRSTIHRLVGGGPALLEDRRRTTESTGERQRRHNRRTPQENQATSIIQLIRADLTAASRALEKDLKEGADPKVVSALLDLAHTLAWGRGVDLRLRVQQVRMRLRQAGYEV